MGNTFSVITITTHGLENVEEEIYVKIDPDFKIVPDFKIDPDVIIHRNKKQKLTEYEGTIHTINNYQKENETYDIQLDDKSIIKAVPKKDIKIMKRTYMPSLFKIPDLFRSFYKINLTSLQQCVTLDLDEVTSINDIIRKTYTDFKNDIDTFLSTVETKLNIRLNIIYKTIDEKYVTIIDCLKDNPERQMVNKYLILDKGEKAEKKNKLYQDSGIFLFDNNNNYENDRDLFQEICNLFEEKYDTTEQRDMSLKKLVEYIYRIEPKITNLIIFDMTCFGIGIGEAGLPSVKQLTDRPDIEDSEKASMYSNIIKYPYGGKKKKQKTKKRKTKTQKTQN